MVKTILKFEISGENHKEIMTKTYYHVIKFFGETDGKYLSFEEIEHRVDLEINISDDLAGSGLYLAEVLAKIK
jgi:hypothetical protein